MKNETKPPSPNSPVSKGKETGDEVYAAFSFRLNKREWGLVFCVTLFVVFLAPKIWKQVEQFETFPDYRIPYQLSKDYWLYQRRVSDVASEKPVFVVGDSVVWGEYVTSDGTLSHFLNKPPQGERLFVNAGVNGLFPLALEGLIRYYGDDIRDCKVLLHCNLLWLSSPKADLRIQKEQTFNHPRLVPQWIPDIPCYRASIDERLGICMERQFTILKWANHIQNAYFDQKSIYSWTLADDGDYPPHYPNAYKNPIANVKFKVPTEPSNDPERGLSSERHKPWSTTGVGTQNFEWVPLENSLQWKAFLRLVDLLEKRGNDVCVVVGPFNEHIMTQENAMVFRGILGEAVEELNQNRVVIVPSTLPSELYGDASHPLTDGYHALARQLFANPEFLSWLNSK